jgi:hypothetical protein
LLLPGEHVITVRQNGYQDFEQRIQVRPGEKQVVRVEMTKAATGAFPAVPSTVKLAVNPSRAAVFLDGRFVGHVAEFEGLGRGLLVAPGAHTIQVSLPGYQTFETQINPLPRQKVEVKTDLLKDNGMQPMPSNSRRCRRRLVPFHSGAIRRTRPRVAQRRSRVIRRSHRRIAQSRPRREAVNHAAKTAYFSVLDTFENTLLELDPTSRIVPTTITRITANITAYSAMSWPCSSLHNAPINSLIDLSPSGKSSRPDRAKTSARFSLHDCFY